MGAESVSWERNLFHGGKLPLTHYGFMGEDLMRSNQAIVWFDGIINTIQRGTNQMN